MAATAEAIRAEEASRASAREAGLRYASDRTPGIRRRRVGKGFTYVDPDGRRVDDPETLARIRGLAIPPAWTDVWICPSPRGHLQATGRDGRGRKQYRYHPRWHEVRDGTKFGRLVEFALALPRIRERVDADLGRQGLPREKVIATVIRLLERTLIRIGNPEYARTNESYGLTTLRTKHVDVDGSTLRLEFTGKGGKRYRVRVSDRRVARVVKRCLDLPGYELFQYVDEDGERRTIDAADVNEYLREVSGEDFTAKDFRTWTGTVLAVRHLEDAGPFTSARQAARLVNAAVKAVADELANTPAVCRRAYIHPDAIEGYLDGTLLPYLTRRNGDAAVEGLDAEEARALAFLKYRARRSAT